MQFEVERRRFFCTGCEERDRLLLKVTIDCFGVLLRSLRLRERWEARPRVALIRRGF